MSKTERDKIKAKVAAAKFWPEPTVFLVNEKTLRQVNETFLGEQPSVSADPE